MNIRSFFIHIPYQLFTALLLIFALKITKRANSYYSENRDF